MVELALITAIVVWTTFAVHFVYICWKDLGRQQ